MTQYEAPLDASHLEGALRLSRAADWNQNERDWAYMIRAGYGWGLFGADGELRATTIALPYAARTPFTWISMVLVLPAYRRHGYATRLLHRAMDAIRDTGSIAQLDATPAGHAVYSQCGFTDAWAFTRWQRDAPPSSPVQVPAPQAGRAAGTEWRRVRDPDWESIARLDRVAFGGDRLALLRMLHQRRPDMAWVAMRGGLLAGYVFGRDGLNATQLGPLVCGDADAGVGLLRRAVAACDGPVFADAPDASLAIIEALQSLGFGRQRPFTRMVLGGAPVAGDASRVGLVAGPELG